MSEVTTEELLPCPFCGDSHFTFMDMTYMHATGPTKGKRVKCVTCGAQAPDTVWNTRAELSRRADVPVSQALQMLINIASRRATFIDGGPGSNSCGTFEAAQIREAIAALSAPSQPSAAVDGDRQVLIAELEQGILAATSNYGEEHKLINAAKKAVAALSEQPSADKVEVPRLTQDEIIALYNKVWKGLHQEGDYRGGDITFANLVESALIEKWVKDAPQPSAADKPVAGSETELLQSELAAAKAYSDGLEASLARYIEGNCCCPPRGEGATHFPGCPMILKEELAATKEKLAKERVNQTSFNECAAELAEARAQLAAIKGKAPEPQKAD